jgi:hypothetical protein
MTSAESYLIEFDAKISGHVKKVRAWGTSVECAWQIILWRYLRANPRPLQLGSRILQVYGPVAGLPDDGAGYRREVEEIHARLRAEGVEIF